MFKSNSTRILDLFAGSGSIGLEALSRGASSATFVDMAEECVKTVKRNADKLRFSSQTVCICAKAEDVLRYPEKYNQLFPFNIISLTPPYEEVLYDTLIDSLCQSRLVTVNSIIILEYPVEMGCFPYIIGDKQLFGLRNRRFGRTVLAMYVNKPTKNFDFRAREFTKESITRGKRSKR